MGITSVGEGCRVRGAEGARWCAANDDACDQMRVRDQNHVHRRQVGAWQPGFRMRSAKQPRAKFWDIDDDVLSPSCRKTLECP